MTTLRMSLAGWAGRTEIIGQCSGVGNQTRHSLTGKCSYLFPLSGLKCISKE
jgi:hypothetical protein